MTFGLHLQWSWKFCIYLQTVVSWLGIFKSTTALQVTFISTWPWVWIYLVIKLSNLTVSCFGLKTTHNITMQLSVKNILMVKPKELFNVKAIPPPKKTIILLSSVQLIDNFFPHWSLSLTSIWKWKEVIRMNKGHLNTLNLTYLKVSSCI